MAKTLKDDDQDKGDEVLRRLLKTPTDSGRKARTSGQDQKQKPGGHLAKNNRPEEDRWAVLLFDGLNNMGFGFGFSGFHRCKPARARIASDLKGLGHGHHLLSRAVARLDWEQPEGRRIESQDQ